MKKSNIRKMKKQVAFLAITGTAAVGMLGVGYGYWNDSITVNAQINTGIVKVDKEVINTSWALKIGFKNTGSIPVILGDNPNMKVLIEGREYDTQISLSFLERIESIDPEEELQVGVSKIDLLEAYISALLEDLSGHIDLNNAIEVANAIRNIESICFNTTVEFNQLNTSEGWKETLDIEIPLRLEFPSVNQEFNKYYGEECVVLNVSEYADDLKYILDQNGANPVAIDVLLGINLPAVEGDMIEGVLPPIEVAPEPPAVTLPEILPEEPFVPEQPPVVVLPEVLPEESEGPSEVLPEESVVPEEPSEVVVPEILPEESVVPEESSEVVVPEVSPEDLVVTE